MGSQSKAFDQIGSMIAQPATAAPQIVSTVVSRHVQKTDKRLVQRLKSKPLVSTCAQLPDTARCSASVFFEDGEVFPAILTSSPSSRVSGKDGRPVLS
jgi:hypothetical protein